MKRYIFKLILVLIGVLLSAISSVYAQTTAVEYLQNGNDAFKQGDYDQAIYDYTKAIDINPSLAKAYDNRGVAYAQKGFLAPAIADFTMALANNPNDAEAYNNRGHAYANQGNLTQAISDYSKAIRINAIYVKAYNNRAHGFYDLKEYEKAWADVHKVEKIGGAVDPDFIEALKKASGRDQ
jgi:tetratricopeptide (TPR) repeat protein